MYRFQIPSEDLKVEIEVANKESKKIPNTRN